MFKTVNRESPKMSAAESRRNVENVLAYYQMMMGSTSFQNALLLAEAAELNFQDESTQNWRQYEPSSSVRLAGAANEANLIRAALSNAIRSDAPEDNRGIHGVHKSK